MVEQRLTVIWDCDRERAHKAWEFVLEDNSVGFRAVARTFGWQRDYDLVRYGSVYCPRPDPEKAAGAEHVYGPRCQEAWRKRRDR
jgi:hypothetical protein